ncbi:hypothetical protein XavaCFBP5823_19595 [Xanthomonas axonopodis pv. vasculorum]|nr:hypothetical protein XavaCFBP5823_19595 [Xanthomonas axonopodis pv. vasculorum]
MLAMSSKLLVVASALLFLLSIAASMGVIVLSRRLQHHEERVTARPDGRKRMLQALLEAIERKPVEESHRYLAAHEAKDVVGIIQLLAMYRRLQRIASVSLLLAVGAGLASGI